MNVDVGMNSQGSATAMPDQSPSRGLRPTVAERVGQPFGFGVSFVGHMAILAGVLVGGQIFQSRSEASLPVADVALISVSDFGGLLSQAPEMQAAVAEMLPPSEPVTLEQPEPVTPPPERVPLSHAGAAPLVTEPLAPPNRPEVVAEVAEVATATQLVQPPPPVPSPAPAPPVQEVESSAPEQPETVDESVTAVAPVTSTPTVVPVVAPAAPPPPRPHVAAPVTPQDDGELAQLLAAVEELDTRTGGSHRKFSSREAGLSFSEYDYIRRKISSCWNVMQVVGAQRAEELRVTIGVHLSADGHVIGDLHLVEPRSLANGAYRTAYDAARAAVERCEPYSKLPRHNYDRWRNLELTFDPEGMIAR